MFYKTALLALASAALAAATGPAKPVYTSNPTVTNISQCNTGDAQCCNTVQKATDDLPATLVGLLGIVIKGVDVVVGLGCTPITVVGLGGGANCAQQPVCCQGNDFHGIINVACTPISLDV